MKGSARRRSASLFLVATALGGFSPTPATFASTTPVAATRPTSASTAAPAGVISVDGSVSVNGVATRNGATIISGSTITTADHATARVDLTGLGRLDFGPGTVATVTFRSGVIDVTLGATGSVRSTVDAGIHARVLTSTPHEFKVVRGSVERDASGAVATAGDAQFVVTVSGTAAPAATSAAKGVDTAAVAAGGTGIGIGAIAGIAAAAVGATVTTVSMMDHSSNGESAKRDVSPSGF